MIPSPERRCRFCGAALESKRSDARYCSSACRAESWRLRRLLSGLSAGRYATPAERLDSYGKRRRIRSQAASATPTLEVAAIKRPRTA